MLVISTWLCSALTTGALLCGAPTPRAHLYANELGRDGTVELPDARQDPHVEMARLLEQIEVRMREIDRLLSDAASGRAVSPSSASASSAGALVKQSAERAKQTIDDIDRLLEVAHHPHPPGGT